MAAVGGDCWRKCEEPAKNLRYVFRSPIANTEAQWLMNRAFQVSGKELKTWPGVDFNMATDEGRALLSSHKRHLGRKTISKVTVFADDGKRQPRPPSLVNHIVDAPPPEGEESNGLVRR